MTILGIDLGTTNSACGIWTEDGVQLIPNRLQNNLTPSVVGIDKQGNVSVGQVAKDRLITHPDFTVGVFKRMMGTVHKIKLGKQQFTATELSALVLRSLKEDAEQFLGHSVEEAVISVPAYFNDNQRQATKSAGELAGFKVERLINEPTAAAMAYGLHEKKEGNFIILDMGGGTFDVSILEYFDGIMEVHASAGDNFLGGEDFVQILYDRILQENGITVDTVTKQEKHIFYQQLEKIKKEIDLLHGRTVQFKLAGQSLDWQVDKVWYEKMVTPLLLRVKKPIEQALRDSNIHSSNLEDIILVGGATKMKVFRSMVGRLFGRLPSCSLDPDVVVAMGASIQAGLKSRNKSLDDLVLTDVCPYTLGTNVVNESGDGKGAYFMPIIERNSVVPVSISRGLFTAHDNQDRLRIGIYQGENRYAEKNIYLGEVNVDIPKGPAGQEEAEVRYSYDMNGLLEVDVKVLSTNKQASIVIENAPGALSPSEKEKARKKLALIKFHPRDNEVNRAVISRGERLFEISLGEKREYVASLLSEFDKVLEKQNPNEIVKQRKIILEKFDDLDDNWL